MLSSTDIFLLSDDSPCQAVVSHGVALDIGRRVREDLIRLFSISNEQDPQDAFFQKAGVGNSKESLKIDSTVRGDYRCWLTPSISADNNLVGVRELVSLIIKTCSSQLKGHHNLNGDYSVQATLYPGNGARYVRHLDAAQTSSSHRGTRRLTFVYYLNETTPASGGNLRLYNLPRRAAGTSATAAEACLEVVPALGTLVVFRSDQVEHEVLPSHQDRWAISLWAYSDNATAATTRPLAVHSTPPLPKVVSPLEQLVQQFLPARGPVPPPRPLPAVGATGAHPAGHNSSSIFVSIVSYRDSELPATVRSLVRAAHSPCRLRLGIVYQLGPGDEESCRLRTEHLQGCWEPRNLDNNSSDMACTCDICTSVSGLSDFQRSERFLVSQVRTLTLPHCEAKGPITARSLATGLYGGERYHLQVDSHMRFRPGWDGYLVGLLESVRATESGPERVCRPVLTTYPQGYHLPDCVPDDTRPTVLMPSHFDANGLLRQEGKLLECTHPAGSSDSNRADTQRYFRSPLWAAGFSFSDAAALLLDAPYSPHLPRLFFGEEQCMAARLFTHGYDFFAPGETVMYHLYSRAHRPAFQTDPSRCDDPQAEAVRIELISREKAQSLETVLDMLALPPQQHGQGEEHLQASSVSSGPLRQGGDDHLRVLQANKQRYGLGKLRTMHEFYAMLRQVGVTFHSSGIQQEGCVCAQAEERLAFLCNSDARPQEEEVCWKFARTASVEVGETISQDTTPHVAAAPVPAPLQLLHGGGAGLDPRALQRIVGFL